MGPIVMFFNTSTTPPLSHSERLLVGFASKVLRPAAFAVAGRGRSGARRAFLFHTSDNSLAPTPAPPQAPPRQDLRKTKPAGQRMVENVTAITTATSRTTQTSEYHTIALIA